VEEALVPMDNPLLSPSLPLSLGRRAPAYDDGCALARECAKTKILRTPSRRAQRALVRVAPAVRKLEPRVQQRALPRASRGAERRDSAGEWPRERGRARRRRRRGGRWRRRVREREGAGEGGREGRSAGEDGSE